MHDTGAQLCDHFDIRVRSIAEARHFYDAFCRALGLTEIVESPEEVVYKAATSGRAPFFLAIDADPNFKASSSRIAFRADSHEEVDRISEAARRAGASEFEAPHLCLEYSEGYYASFFCDPDGTRYEICYRQH